MGFLISIERPSELGLIIVELPEVATLEEAIDGCTRPQTLVSAKVLKRGYALVARDEQGVIVHLRVITKAAPPTTVEVTEKNISFGRELSDKIFYSGFGSRVLDVRGTLRNRDNWWGACESGWAMAHFADAVGIPRKLVHIAAVRCLRTTLKMLSRAVPDPAEIISVMMRHLNGEATKAEMETAATLAEQLHDGAMAELARAGGSLGDFGVRHNASGEASVRAHAAQAIMLTSKSILDGSIPQGAFVDVANAHRIMGERVDHTAKVGAAKVVANVIRQTIPVREVLYAIQVQAWKAPA